MQKQTNDGHGPLCAPDFEILPLKFWKVSSEFLAYSNLENLLFEHWIKKWSHTVNVSACAKL